jgi:hypothetical protein
MSKALLDKLSQALAKIDRPGSFCASGSVPAVLPGLEVEGLGPIGLPLTTTQAEELKPLCQQAPYGKGEETIVDTSVRRVRQLKPEHFTLTNPEWDQFLKQIVKKVQQELGLENQKLEAHLYDLLLYEPGSFFLPHRDGEKLPRMVATLVITLPSSFQGGELVVRHEGQEQTIDPSSECKHFRIHFAAFYADCEHEVRPLREGHRLSLVYNLTLKKGKKGLTAPRIQEHIDAITPLVRDWAREATGKLAITLEHEYTQKGLAWDALKGVDRVKAQVLLAAAQQADCQTYLALLTLHEAGSAEPLGGYGYSRYGRRRWDYDDEDEDAGDYEMGEVYDTSLTAEHWSDSSGKRLPIDSLEVEEDELLDPEALRDIEPEEDFEGYTGNAGMTLDRWYRHGAIFLWPNRKHFEVLCDAGGHSASQALKTMVGQWQRAKTKNAPLKAQCIDFASAIIGKWPENPHSYRYGPEKEEQPLLASVVALDEPSLIKGYLAKVLARDAAADPGKSLVETLNKHGWGTFQPELKAVFKQTTDQTIERNVRLLEQICLAKQRTKEGWKELCYALAGPIFQALEVTDREKAGLTYAGRTINRADLLTALTRSLLASEQFELLSRVVAHTLARADKYPLRTVQMPALTKLQPWLAKHVKKPCPALSQWLASCREQLESLTAQAPQAPADFRRPATISCNCADCAELKRFLDDPQEKVHRFPVRQNRRLHLEQKINEHHCDVDCTTDESRSPYTLVCTKNTASYKAKVKTFEQDREYLATVRAIEARLPKR